MLPIPVVRVVDNEEVCSACEAEWKECRGESRILRIDVRRARIRSPRNQYDEVKVEGEALSEA